MSKDNKIENPSIIELYDKQYDIVVELVNKGKQNKLNKAVDTLLKLFSLAVLIEQQEQHYDILTLEQEVLDEMFNDMDEDLQGEVTINDQKNTEAIVDKSLEYYSSVRKQLKDQITKDIFHIRDMNDEELKEYINSLF